MLQFDELRLELEGLRPEIDDLAEALGLERMRNEIAELDTKASMPGFWDDTQNSQKILQRSSSLKDKIAAYEKLTAAYDDTMALIELGNEEGDESLLPEAKEDSEGEPGELYIMGEYCNDMMGKYINLYYGSFAALAEQEDWTEEDWEDELYTTLQNGEFSVRIDKNTRDSHFYIMGVDNAGNRTGYLVIANPFYEKETPVPSPTPEQHSTHCPADCDCRKQSYGNTGSSGNTGSNGSNTGAGKPSNASGSTGKTAAAQTPAATEPAKAQEPTDTAAPVAIEKGTGFSQNGSAVTRDLLYDKHTNKQFIAVETRNGHTLYLVIDYDKPLDEDGDQYETYFLNLVDESDLLALIDEDSAPVCSCKDKCEAGAVNTACAVCKNNMTECMGKEKATEKTPEPDPTPDTSDSPDKDGGEKKSGSGLVVIVLLLLMAGGGALYWFKLRKKKPDTKGPVDLDDYDYGDDEDEEYENEDDADEPEETEDADA